MGAWGPARPLPSRSHRWRCSGNPKALWDPGTSKLPPQRPCSCCLLASLHLSRAKPAGGSSLARGSPLPDLSLPRSPCRSHGSWDAGLLAGMQVSPLQACVPYVHRAQDSGDRRCPPASYDSQNTGSAGLDWQAWARCAWLPDDARRGPCLSPGQVELAAPRLSHSLAQPSLLIWPIPARPGSLP